MFGLDIWTALCTLACFGESAGGRRIIQLTGKIISEHNGMSLFKIGRRKLWLELPKDDWCRSQYIPLVYILVKGAGVGNGIWHIVKLDWPLWANE